MFVEKARILEKAGAKGGIVIDNNKGSTSTNSPLFSMSGDGVDDVSIPMVFIFYNDAKDLLEALKARPNLEVSLLDSSDASTKDQDLTEQPQEEHDITSPVRSFLEKSRQQVEKYWKSMVNNNADDEKQRDLESVFLRTIFNNGEQDDEEEDEDDSTVLKAGAAFSKLEDFLNPDNAAIKKLVEHRVLKNPTVLSELLEVNISDLLKAFQNIMSVKASSIEAAYLHLLQLVEDEGADGIIRLAALDSSGDDELVHAFASGEKGNNQFEYKMANDKTKTSPLKDLTAAEALQKSVDSKPIEHGEELQKAFDNASGKDEL